MYFVDFLLLFCEVCYGWFFVLVVVVGVLLVDCFVGVGVVFDCVVDCIVVLVDWDYCGCCICFFWCFVDVVGVCIVGMFGDLIE